MTTSTKGGLLKPVRWSALIGCGLLMASACHLVLVDEIEHVTLAAGGAAAATVGGGGSGGAAGAGGAGGSHCGTGGFFDMGGGVPCGPNCNCIEPSPTPVNEEEVAEARPAPPQPKDEVANGRYLLTRATRYVGVNGTPGTNLPLLKEALEWRGDFVEIVSQRPASAPPSRRNVVVTTQQMHRTFTPSCCIVMDKPATSYQLSYDASNGELTLLQLDDDYQLVYTHLPD